MNKFAKITRCSNDAMWYRDKIGEIYKIKFIDDSGDIVVDLENDLGQLGSIINADADIFEEEIAREKQ